MRKGVRTMRKRICLQSLPFTCSLFILLAGLMTIVGCAPTTAVPPDRVISENRWDESIVRIFGIGMMNLQGQYTGKQYPKAFPELSHGTGIILTKNGLIVTNRHVVENREGLVVKINNSDRSLPAKIVYVDRKYDLAFILIKVDDLGFFPFKEKNINANIQRGDVVNVLGFPIDPNQRQASYTSGVVSRTVT